MDTEIIIFAVLLIAWGYSLLRISDALDGSRGGINPVFLVLKRRKYGKNKKDN